MLCQHPEATIRTRNQLPILQQTRSRSFLCAPAGVLGSPGAGSDRGVFADSEQDRSLRVHTCLCVPPGHLLPGTPSSGRKRPGRESLLPVWRTSWRAENLADALAPPEGCTPAGLVGGGACPHQPLCALYWSCFYCPLRGPGNALRTRHPRHVQ